MSIKEKSEHGRIYGLDVFRSIAVLFVIVGHTLEHANPPAWAQVLARAGGLGVEIFFVLSGFLIGGILIDLIEKGRLANFSDVRSFWMRRWLRTLPLYFFILILFIRFDYLGRHALGDYPAYWIFMQNFAWPIDKFFGLSWSLTIEEHFYLWFPLIFLLFYSLTKRPRLSIIFSISALFGGVIFYRLHLPLLPDYDAFNYHSRMVVLGHLDGIAAGLAIVALMRWKRSVYELISRLTPVWVFFCIIIFAWYFMGLPGIELRWVQVWIKTIEVIAFALLLPWFAGLVDVTRTGMSSFFTLTSRISYSLYLTHILVIILINKALLSLGLFDRAYVPIVIYPLYFSGYYLASWLTYLFVEKRFLDLRQGSFSFYRIFMAAWPAGLCSTAVLIFY